MAALTITVLAAVLLPLCVSAETNYMPHEDPNAVSDELNKDSLLQYYTQIFMAIDQGDYTSAVKMLNKIDFAHIPEEQRQLLAQYGGLIGRLPDTIPTCKNLLETVTPLIAEYRLTEAQEKLDETNQLIDQLSLTVADIERDTGNIGNAFGVFLSPSNSQLNTSFRALQNSVGLIKETETKISTLQTLIDDAWASTSLQKTTLTLDMSAETAYVGDNITVSGALSADTSVLTWKNISILINGEPVATTTTDYDGKYTTPISLPYIYASPMTVRALYTPTDSDANIYLPSISQPQNISVLFYQSEIQIDAPTELNLGLPAAFNGTVSWEKHGDSATRNISIYLDEKLIGTAATGIGPFEVKTVIALNESLGKHSIRAILSPDGRYAEAEDQKTVNVSKTPFRVDVNAPSFTILPNEIKITGKVSSALPMEGGTAVINFGGQTATVDIQDNGEFSADLSIGVAWGLIGSQELTVTVNPVETWNAASTVKAEIFVLNAVNIAGISLCLVAGATIGTVTYTRRKHRRPLREPTRRPIAPAAIEKLLATTQAAALQPGSGEPRERLLNAYAMARDVIEKASTTTMAPYMTMREFSRAIEQKGFASAGNFGRLTRMAEMALYSPHATEALEAAEAEKLFSAIVEGIQRGAA